MHYFRKVYSILFLFLISTILIANQSPTASGFETQGAVGPSSFDLGLPIHEEITRDGLYFLKSDTLDSIVSQHVKIEQDPSSPNHFDNCQFAETVSRINLRYDAAIDDLNPKAPNLPQAEESFGYILHAAQDFYAHTNWIEMGRTDLIDPWLGHWTPLNSYTESSNNPPVFILEEDGKSHSNFQIYKNGKVITVSNPTWNFTGRMGLISGTYDADINKCPPSASIPHGGKISTIINRITPDESRDLPDELNKDNPSMRGHWTARTLAIQQTTHEFCRLLDLEKAKYGDEGVKFINDNWVQDQYLIDSPANNSRCPNDSTLVSMIPDSSTSNAQNDVAIPSWIKNNAKYWSDGSLTDKEFATGIGYLVKQKIISSNVTTDANGEIVINDNLNIPKWIKNNAKYWYDGSISNSDFVSGIDYMIGQKIISFSEPVQNQDVISNDDIVALYTATKKYQNAVSSIAILNDDQMSALKSLTSNSWYTDPTNTKDALHGKVLDLMLQKQSIDKKNIQDVSDWLKDVSDKIKEYGEKQGVEHSILEQIDSETKNPDKSTSQDPVTELKQDAHSAQISVDDAKQLSGRTESTHISHSGGTLSGLFGYKNSPLEQFRLDEQGFISRSGDYLHDLSGYSKAELNSLLNNYHDQLTTSEINDINAQLEILSDWNAKVTGLESKLYVLDLMQQTIDLLNSEEQTETDSILNQISDSGMLELSPIEKPPIQIQSQHGSYLPEENADTYTIVAVWVLKPQNGIEHTSAYVQLIDMSDPTKNSKGMVSINKGVIQISVPHMGPGTYVAGISSVDGLSPPDGSRIEIVIPPKQGTSETPSTVQTTPNTPLIQNTIDFSVPPQIIQEATSSSGAIVHFTISPTSPGGNTGIVTCNPSDGSQFPLGTTTVTCTATDLSTQKTIKKSITVIVRDTTPPAISAFNPHNDTPDDSGAIVYFTMEANDLVDGPITPHCDHMSGSKFTFGTTIVTCTADDSHGNHSERKLGITITKS